jgi:signal transduction histidine kinase
MAGIIRQVLAFAHRPHSAMQPVDLCEAAQASVGFVASAVERSRKTIRLRDDASPLMVMADRVQIEQVLTNLLLNALQASGQRARIEVGFTREVRHPPDLGPGSERPVACVYVDDNGTGIPGEHLPHIFEPYYTTKDVDEGTGLGLAIAYTIVHEHGGWIDVQSDVGVGSRFSVYLPAESPSESDARPAPQPVGSTWSRWG